MPRSHEVDQMGEHQRAEQIYQENYGDDHNQTCIEPLFIFLSHLDIRHLIAWVVERVHAVVRGVRDPAGEPDQISDKVNYDDVSLQSLFVSAEIHGVLVLECDLCHGFVFFEEYQIPHDIVLNINQEYDLKEPRVAYVDHRPVEVQHQVLELNNVDVWKQQDDYGHNSLHNTEDHLNAARPQNVHTRDAVGIVLWFDDVEVALFALLDSFCGTLYHYC